MTFPFLSTLHSYHTPRRFFSFPRSEILNSSLSCFLNSSIAFLVPTKNYVVNVYNCHQGHLSCLVFPLVRYLRSVFMNSFGTSTPPYVGLVNLIQYSLNSSSVINPISTMPYGHSANTGLLLSSSAFRNAALMSIISMVQPSSCLCKAIVVAILTVVTVRCHW
jgi:hypothetical protein